MGFLIQLSIITIGLIVIGVLYAVIIYNWPVERTWLEVFIGVGVTIAGEMLATAIVLLHYELLSQLWWIIPFPLAAFACTGLPMIIGQEIKLRRQKRDGEKFEGVYNGPKATL